MKCNDDVTVGAAHDKYDGDEQSRRVIFKQNSNNIIDIDVDIDDDECKGTLQPPKASLFKLLLTAVMNHWQCDSLQWFFL